MLYRNSQKRFYKEGLIYSITSNTKGWVPWFEDEELCEIWLNTLIQVKQLKGFDIYAFCLLPDHFHLLLRPTERFNLSVIMKSFKENSSQDINKYLRSNEGATSTSRLHQEYDIEKFRWHKSFHDHYIRNVRDFKNQWNYISYNHLKSGLPRNWEYISLNYPDLIDRYRFAS